MEILKPTEKLRRLFRYIFLLVNLVFVLGLLVSYLSSYISPGDSWWPSLIGLAYPYFLFINILFVVFWVIFYWKYLFFSFISVLAGINVLNNYYQVSGKTNNAEDGLKILSYNVANFYSFLQDKKKEYTVLDFIADQKADIICLQETKLQKTGDLNPVKLKAYFPGINHCQLAHQSKWNGPVTFSRYPIVKMGEMRFDNSNNIVIYTDVDIDNDTVRIYNCHLQSYGIRTDDYSVIDTLGFQNEKIIEMKIIGKKLRDANQHRSVQVRQLKDHIDNCPYPVIVCGDFNDTPISYTYHIIGTNLSDAFVESGEGISNTYRGKLPSFRIDYILYSDDFEAFNYIRHKVVYSDHFPISATLFKKLPGINKNK